MLANTGVTRLLEVHLKHAYPAVVVTLTHCGADFTELFPIMVTQDTFVPSPSFSKVTSTQVAMLSGLLMCQRMERAFGG